MPPSKFDLIQLLCQKEIFLPDPNLQLEISEIMFCSEPSLASNVTKSLHYIELFFPINLFSLMNISFYVFLYLYLMIPYHKESFSFNISHFHFKSKALLKVSMFLKPIPPPLWTQTPFPNSPNELSFYSQNHPRGI